MEKTRVCNGCGVEKFLTEDNFYYYKTKSFLKIERFAGTCIECRREYQRGKYEEVKERRSKNNHSVVGYNGLDELYC